MLSFDDLEFGPHPLAGEKARISFANGWDFSIARWKSGGVVKSIVFVKMVSDNAYEAFHWPGEDTIAKPKGDKEVTEIMEVVQGWG